MDATSLPPEPPQRRLLDVAALQQATKDLTIGHPFLYFSELTSTNSYAHDLARRTTPNGTLVTTDHQTAGRGRVGRAWRSLPGEQLAISLILYPQFPAHFLVMASALAVAEAIEAVVGVRPGIKWPNDVLLDGRKVCGILIETSADFAVLGIGINVNGSFSGDPELATRAITLAQALGHEVSREALAIELLARLDDAYLRLQYGGEPARAALRDEWRGRLVMLGQRVMIRQGGQALDGIAEDVDAGGALLLRLANGSLQTILWGDVE
jgi:BirA family biotin operon repressor/biotin-[acetyl-CoA-carboxylase] ligase